MLLDLLCLIFLFCLICFFGFLFIIRYDSEDIEHWEDF